MKWLVPYVLLAVFATLTITAMSRQSATSDEVLHLPAGYTFLQTGDFRMSAREGHPPLIEAVTAIPLFGLDLKPIWETAAWRSGDVWAFGNDLIANNREPMERILFRGRLPVVVLGLLTGMLLFIWARELWGEWPAAFVLFLFAFCPTMLGHSGLATNDVGVTLLTLITLYCLWRFAHSGRLSDAGYCGLALGAALLAKFSAAATAVSVGVLLASIAWVRTRRVSPDDAAAARSPISWPTLVRAALLIGFLVVVTISIGFGFPKGLINYVAGLRARSGLDQGRLAFLWGDYAAGGFWYYFLLAQLWKTPVPTLLFFGAALLLVDVSSAAQRLRWGFILLPIVAFHAVGMFYGVNIGVRHMLPAFPFLFLASGATAQWVGTQGPACKVVFAALCLWLVVGTLRVWPHFIAYFNELAGGPEHGVYYLGDSNIEWGQDLYGVKRYIDDHAAARIGLAIATTIPPERYGIANEPIKLRDMVWPQEGVTYFIGAQYLQRPSFLPGNPALRFHWLERYAPIAKIGWSIYVYRFSTEPADHERRDVFYLPKEKWYGDAIGTLEAVIARAPDFQEARQLLAEVYLERGEWLAGRREPDAALLDYMNAVRVAPQTPRYREQFRDGIGAVQADRTIQPQAAAAQCGAGILRAGAGEIGPALHSLLACLQREPQRLDARTSLAQVYWRLGLMDWAQREWEQCLRIDPSYAPARQRLDQLPRDGTTQGGETP